jgi:hypothetical protein
MKYHKTLLLIFSASQFCNKSHGRTDRIEVSHIFSAVPASGITPDATPDKAPKNRSFPLFFKCINVAHIGENQRRTLSIAATGIPFRYTKTIWLLPVPVLQ